MRLAGQDGHGRNDEICENKVRSDEWNRDDGAGIGSQTNDEAADQ